MLQNTGFEDGWDDISTGEQGGWLVNQIPKGWDIFWQMPGNDLWDDGSTEVQTIPEMLHKLNHQLPPNEQRGGADALILDGQAVYKIFAREGAFAGQLAQRVTGLKPGSMYAIKVPVQIHAQGIDDPWGAEFGIRMTGMDDVMWVNFGTTGDRVWSNPEASVIVPENGEVMVELKCKSKYGRFDFFVDRVIEVSAVGAGSSTPVEPTPEPAPAPVDDVRERLQAARDLIDGVLAEM